MKRKRLYLFATFGEEKGVDLLAKAYAELPMIGKVERYDADSILIWFKGEESGVPVQIQFRNIPDWGAMIRTTPEGKIRNLESFMGLMAEILSKEGYLMLGCRHGGIGSFSKTLFPLAATLQTARSEDEFLAKMEADRPSGGIPEQDLKNFWKHREQAPVWEARAKQLYADYLEANLSREEGLEALETYLRAAPSADALIATLQAKRPRLLCRIVGKNADGNPVYSHGLFYEEELREFFKNRNDPEGWRPKPPPPYKPPSEIIATISAALAKAKTETEFRTALVGKFTDADWHGGFKTWDKFLAFIWERRDRPRHEWSGEPSSPPVVYTNAPSDNPAFDW